MPPPCPIEMIELYNYEAKARVKLSNHFINEISIKFMPLSLSFRTHRNTFICVDEFNEINHLTMFCCLHNGYKMLTSQYRIPEQRTPLRKTCDVIRHLL